MSVLKWSGVRAIFVSLCITIVFAVFIWKLNFIDIIAYDISGILEVSNIIFIIFGAILLLNILTKAGAINVINNSFNNISMDSRIHILLIGLAFNTFLNGIAAFGTEIALSTLVLISLGFPAFPAAIIALAFNAPFISFGAVGVPTITAIALTKNSAQDIGLNITEYANQVSSYSAFLHSIAGMVLTIIVLFIVIKIFAKEKSWKPFLEIIPFALLNSAFMYAAYYWTAKYLGPDLPTVIAGIVGLTTIILTTKFKLFLPKTVWTFPPAHTWSKLWIPAEHTGKNKNNLEPKEDRKAPNPFKAWLPYILCSVILVVSRIPSLGVQGMFKHYVLRIHHLFGLEKVNYDFLWLYSPGIMPFLMISVLAIFMFNLKTKEVKEVLFATWDKSKLAILAIILSVMMVSIMLKSSNNPVGLQGMLTSIAALISNLQGVGVIIITPIIGALGTFVSGSNTTSNILFTNTAFDIATITSVPNYVLVSLQNVGGGAGIMFCFKNILIVSSITGLKNREGHMLNYMLLISLIYILLLLLTVFATI